MSTPSNLYAEKVFSEHPIALWALDETVDYVNLLNEEKRRFDSWQTIDGAAFDVVIDYTSPFPNIETNTLSVTEEFSESGQVVCISDDIINFSTYNQLLKTFSIGGYFFSKTNNLSSIDLGYEYYDTATGTMVQNLKTFFPPISNKWFFLSETFEIPSENTTMRIVLKFNYIVLPESTVFPEFLVNGLTIGQWSEEFNSSSLGVQIMNLPDINGFENTDRGIKAYAYGVEDIPGYYIVSDGTLKAKNTGVPIVYGAKGITQILPNNEKPSLVVPGRGFLHENGKHKEYTFEMWLKLNNDSQEPKKIFGPIGTSDGIWVDGPFIILRIYDKWQSHYIGEWGKPMLLDIRYSSVGASLLINGDTAIEMDFDSKNIFFSEDSNLDWLGFWSYDDTFPMEIDCIGIYSYQVANLVAKRRFVYGQGVDFPENVNTSYSGSSVFIDYQFANYANSYVYPDLGKWNDGVRNNLAITNRQLSTPDYSLPRMVFSSGSSTDFKLANFTNSYQNLESETSFSFDSNQSVQNNGYLIFDDFNFLQEDVKAFYAVIKPTTVAEDDEVILHIDSESTQNYFSIILSGLEIKYVLKYNGVLQELYKSSNVGIGEIFPVGIDIEQFTYYFGSNASAFFGNRGDLRFYVGGNSKFDKSFHGKFYSVGFCNAYSLNEVSSLFNAKGVVLEYEDIFDTYASYIDIDAGEYTGDDPLFWSFILDGGSPYDYSTYRLKNHIASYTLFVKKYFDEYYFDIAVKGSWRDYIPLTSLAKYTKNSNNENTYSLDFVQFNIDYPAPSQYLETAGDPVEWLYGQPNVLEDGTVIPSLLEEFSYPDQKTYTELDNHLYTGYNDYLDLKNKSGKTYTYNTEKSYVKSYVMFEYLSSGLTMSDLYFSNKASTPKNGVISPDSNWINTMYEVVDGVTIYPPKEDINNLALVTKLEFVVDGIMTHKIKVKTVEYAAQALDSTSPNPVGTRFGENLYPYVKTGYYYNYKAKNPFSIYKKSSPYLYLTRNSGISLKGDYSTSIQRGLTIPINKSMTDNFSIVVMQLGLRFDQDFFPYSPMQIFEVESPTSHIKFFMVANSSDGKRARIYAINAKTKKLENNILFYLNGNIVSNPVITVKDWAFLGVQFGNMPNFDNNVGSIKLTAPMTYNSVSYYKSTALQEIQQVAKRPWLNVKYLNQDTLDWAFWYDDPDHAFQWGDILYVSTVAFYGVTPSKIYDTYVGTNKTIIDDNGYIKVANPEYTIYQGISSQQITVTPV
jgi:hypothetical protein